MGTPYLFLLNKIRVKNFINVIICLLFFVIQCKANHHFTKNPLDREKEVEYFLKLPPKPHDKNPLIILIHGHQPDPRPGGMEFLTNGLLEIFAQKGFIAAAVSQPGPSLFGEWLSWSKGDFPDYFGPFRYGDLGE